MPLTKIAESDSVVLLWQIDLPRIRVWRCLTQPDLIRQWLGHVVNGQVHDGSDFAIDHGDGYICRSTVTSWTEPSKLDITWHFPDEPASTVSLDLHESHGSTEVRLTHRDLGNLTTSYRDGWCVHLSYLEAAAHGTPLPPSMFWRLHSTMAYLRSR